MQVIPALDIMGGRVVRLTRGDPETSVLYSCGSPLEAAERWSREGVKLLHIVDIDAALLKGSNRDQILEIVESLAVKAQVGGGIRDKHEATSLLDAGVYRIVLGSYALSNPGQAVELLEEYGPERIAIALDHRGGRILTKGWTETTEKLLIEALRAYASLGFVWFLVTDTDRDGALAGPDVETYREISNLASIIASGGVSKLEDLVALRDAGASAAVVGKALYEERFTYREAVSALEGL
jgi:phosphoribosylformimino-5-aminoimidazole carboxamide ribotide isomerase